jgi:hypothetical protein
MNRDCNSDTDCNGDRDNNCNNITYNKSKDSPIVYMPLNILIIRNVVKISTACYSKSNNNSYTYK